jgi:hypothetical protein
MLVNVASAAACDEGGNGEMVSHTSADVKTCEIIGNGQNFSLMNLKCMLHQRYK